MFKSQKEIYDKLNEKISPLSSDKIIFLSGKSGVGKSFVINSLKNSIQNRYSSPICYLNGDSVCQNRDYYCFKYALNNMTIKYEQRKKLTIIASKTVSDIPYCGTVSQEILSDIFDQFEIRQKQKNYFLNDDEQDIVYRLNYLFDKKDSLIICDNIQYFDAKSLELLYLLITSEEETFDFLKNCQFLFIYTESGENISPIIKKIIEEKVTVKYKISSIQFEEIEEVLNVFNCKIHLDNEIKKIIFKLADGHLEVIKQIILQMNDSVSNLDSMAKSSDAKEALDKLITDKLSSLGASGCQISQVLEYASLIGKTFSNSELSQIVELNKQEFYDAINKSNEMELINTQNYYSNFSHDIIQLLFKKKAGRNLNHYYSRMKECIKELYPADYKQRIEIAENLGDIHEAIKLASLYYIKRKYAFDPNKEENYIQIISLNSEIKDFLDDMHSAYVEFNNENYEHVISILNHIVYLIPIELSAEKDILKSIALTKSLNDDKRQEAINCLDNYNLESLNNEGDLYLRILLAKISAYSHMSQTEDAKRCEKEIIKYLEPKQYYDDTARTLIYILYRKANSMHECNYAEKYINKSVVYFAPLPGQKAPLNPIQYLMSLGNHAGILIECGKFDEAYIEIKKAQNLVRDNSIKFPRLHIIDNNYLLSVYLSDNSQKGQILEAYKKLLYLPQNADNIFIQSNYCALLAVNGEPQKACDMLEEIKSKLPLISEKFYESCIYNNLLVLKLYFKQYEEAEQLLNELKSYNKGILDEAYYQKKYEIFQKSIDSQLDIPIEKIDDFIFDFCSEYQESWNYWGRSFDYTALYYWSDI